MKMKKKKTVILASAAVGLVLVLTLGGICAVNARKKESEDGNARKTAVFSGIVSSEADEQSEGAVVLSGESAVAPEEGSIANTEAPVNEDNQAKLVSQKKEASSQKKNISNEGDTSNVQSDTANTEASIPVIQEVQEEAAPTEKPYQPRPMNPEVLSAEMERQIKVDTAEYYSDAERERYVTPESIVIQKYCGTYGNCVAYYEYISNTPYCAASLEYQIGGIWFSFPNQNEMKIWRDGEILKLKQAYEMGYLSIEDLKDIRHYWGYGM